MNQLLKDRIKSFGWRTGMMVLAFTVSTMAGNLGLLHLSVGTTGLLGLFLGEVSKFLNTYLTETPVENPVVEQG